MLVLAAGCMVKPPVQEMAEARSAISAAQSLPKADAVRLQEAEKSLHKASEAIAAQRYEQARRLAIEAREQARKAAAQ